MKQMISLLLALALVMGMSTVAFAAETNQGAGTYSTDVNGLYVPGTTGSGKVFSVDLDWSSMSFTYHAAKTPEWDTTNHKYSDMVAAYWEGSGSVTVTNHSNEAISVTPAFTADTGYNVARMNFSTESLHIPSSEFIPFGQDHTGIITVTPAGSLPANTDGKIGSITVTIAESQIVTQKEMDALLEPAAEFASMARYDSDLADLLDRDGYLLSNLEIAVVDAGMNTTKEKYQRLKTYYNQCLAAANAYQGS